MVKLYSFTLFWPRHGLGGEDDLFGHVHESVAGFQAQCKYHGLRCEYRHMANPEEELIRDRFASGIRDDKLRAELLRHTKDDGSMWAVAKENSPLGDFHFFKINRFEILKKNPSAAVHAHSFDDRIGRPKSDKKHEKRLRFFVGFAPCVCFVVSTMTSRRLSIDRVYSSSTAAAPTAELLGEDDRDFFGELDELESADSVTLEEVSSSGRAQSLPSDSGVDLGGDEEGVSFSELETSLQESVSRAARARSTGSSDTCEDHFIDPDLDREKVREAHSAQKCSCREQHNCLKAFKQEEIIKLRQNMMEMTNVERDMLIMGKLQARSYARGADRQRTKFTYAIDYRSLSRKLSLCSCSW